MCIRQLCDLLETYLSWKETETIFWTWMVSLKKTKLDFSLLSFWCVMSTVMSFRENKWLSLQMWQYASQMNTKQSSNLNSEQNIGPLIGLEIHDWILTHFCNIFIDN